MRPGIRKGSKMKSYKKLFAPAVALGLLMGSGSASAAVMHDISGPYGPGGIEILLGFFNVSSTACDTIGVGGNNCSFDNNADIIAAGVDFSLMVPSSISAGGFTEITEQDLDSLTYIRSAQFALELSAFTLEGYGIETHNDVDVGTVENPADFFADNGENLITIWDGEDFEPVVPAAVPLPAALPLYGTALGLIGLVGWRKRRNAQKETV